MKSTAAKKKSQSSYNKIGKREKYTKISCNACKRVHRKCNGGPDEPCSWCLAKGCECVKVDRRKTKKQTQNGNKKAKQALEELSMLQEGKKDGFELSELLPLLQELAKNYEPSDSKVKPASPYLEEPKNPAPEEYAYPPISTENEMLDQPLCDGTDLQSPMWTKELFDEFPTSQNMDISKGDLNPLKSPQPNIEFDDFFEVPQKPQELTQDQVKQLLLAYALQAQQKKELEKTVEYLKRVILSLSTASYAINSSEDQTLLNANKIR